MVRMHSESLNPSTAQQHLVRVRPQEQRLQLHELIERSSFGLRLVPVSAHNMGTFAHNQLDVDGGLS